MPMVVFMREEILYLKARLEVALTNSSGKIYHEEKFDEVFTKFMEGR